MGWKSRYRRVVLSPCRLGKSLLKGHFNLMGSAGPVVLPPCPLVDLRLRPCRDILPAGALGRAAAPQRGSTAPERGKSTGLAERENCPVRSSAVELESL